MKIKTTFLFIFVWAQISAYSAVHVITNSGSAFSPNTISILEGDTIKFQLGQFHDAVEVDKGTYDANGSTSNSGFSVPFGGGDVKFTTAGTYYYICENHIGSGMKGIITVTTNTKVNSIESNLKWLNLYPNPAVKNVNIQLKVANSGNISVDLIDISGKKVQQLLAGNLNAGDYLRSVSLQNKIVSGRYFVKYSSNDKVFVQPLLIIKE